jgi:murein DD-endopeptidase MepM/ murein hydrolase activator NlpD
MRAFLLRRPRTYACVAVATAATLAGCGSPPRDTGARLAADIRLAAETIVVRNVVPRNTTLDALLREHGVEGDTVRRVVGAMAGVFDPRQLRSLQPFVLERSALGALRVFEYEIDADRFLRISPTDRVDELGAEILPIPKTLQNAAVAGAIDGTASSLFAAMKTTGEGDELALALAQIFSGEIDFNTDIQRGDRFAVSFERFHRDGRPATYGRITSAEFDNGGRLMRAFLFTPPGGVPAFYDEQGRALVRLFRKSPLEFEPRITSGFSMNRRHPVLHTSRAHRGVDYGAPTGAPVVSVANGTVVSATYDNANGRMVRVRHASGYQSYYLHLSRFADGIRAGVRVSQGQRIGYVGSTGLSTGPHLHYGLTKNGTFVNPVVEHRNMPPGEPIPAPAMAAFLEVRDRELAALAGAVSGDEADAPLAAQAATRHGFTLARSANQTD